MSKYNLTTPAAIRNAAGLARTAAGNEPNQNGYNAAWLHGYAHALREVSERLKPTPGPFTAKQLQTIKTALHLEIIRNREHAAQSAATDPELLEHNAQIIAQLESALQAVTAAI